MSFVDSDCPETGILFLPGGGNIPSNIKADGDHSRQPRKSAFLNKEIPGYVQSFSSYALGLLGTLLFLARPDQNLWKNFGAGVAAIKIMPMPP